MNPLVPTPSTTWANGNLDLSGGTSDTYSQTSSNNFWCVIQVNGMQKLKLHIALLMCMWEYVLSKTPANLI